MLPLTYSHPSDRLCLEKRNHPHGIGVTGIAFLSLKKILLVTGQYLYEDPYREIRIKRMFEKRGIKVLLAVPTRAICRAAAADGVVENDPVFKENGARLFNDEYDFGLLLRGCQLVLFSTWKSYRRLTDIAKAQGRLTISFNSTTGMDGWDIGVDLALIQSPFNKKIIQWDHENFHSHSSLSDNLKIVGSVHYENQENFQLGSLSDRKFFCQLYGLDPGNRIAVLFPKGIGSFRYKSKLWFPDWSDEQIDQYNQKLIDKYRAICEKIRQTDCQLLVKMHPSSYASYLCKSDEEYAFWSTVPGIRILKPEHTLAMFHHLNVGLSVTSHIAMDLGYFKKPCIFVEPDTIKSPDNIRFDYIRRVNLPKGPSHQWDKMGETPENPWFSSWLGTYSTIEDLPEQIADFEKGLTLRKDHIEIFVREFWHRNDGKTSERILEETIRFAEYERGLLRQKISGRYWLIHLKEEMRAFVHACLMAYHSFIKS